MSERQQRTRRRAASAPDPSGNGNNPQAAETAVAAVVGEQSGDQPGQQSMPHPAVLVMRVPGPEPGQERVEMMEVNGIDPLAIPTLLRMAANLKEQNLGIGERR